ncbi:MAG: TetR/AcrR family transcriptional regulator [Oscillospiraceae bacterium]|nr:TetR/AcrR family transcriptional regulator [Oscillospiraceae bacterium]
MKREEKNALSRQRILDAAADAFSRSGYDGMSMNTLCAENGISKGLLYHYFKDKDALYLLCVQRCFDAVTDYLIAAARGLSGCAEQRLRAYFDARLRFFAENPACLGIFAGAAFSPPAGLAPEIAQLRRKFDALNISVLTELLRSEPLRSELSVDAVVYDFGMYMDFFNLHFKSAQSERSDAAILKEHEERCHRQLHILLYGVLDQSNEQ